MAKRILLADDSVTIRRVVELTFADSAYHVESVGSGSEALERIAVLRPDLVLADVVMPDPSGYEICRQVKDSDRPVPVLLLAGTFESFDEPRARACGADGHLLKPFESRALVQRVEALLRQAEQHEASQEATRELREPATVGAAASGGQAAKGTAAADAPLPPESIEAIARAVLSRLSEDVVREVAREVVPEVAERIVRERIRELEQEE
jgi:CheY-like chemotaxis protein